MLKFFKGIVSSGTWVVFDEFNRMQQSMMVLFTQLIAKVQSSIRAETNLIVVEDKKVHIDKNCAFFLTMNPGYAGRVEILQSLKSMFRPVSMVVPNY